MQHPRPELVIYSYDSFNAPEGIGPKIIPKFEQLYQCRVKVLSSTDGGQILTRIQLDAQRGKPVAHLAIGIDQLLFEQVKPWVENWNGWSPNGFLKIDPHFRVQDSFLPYDYGILSFIFDQRSLTKKENSTIPKTIHDLLKPEWKKNIILQDPRTSTPGLTFLWYTQIILGASTKEYWKSLRSQWLTLTIGWDQAYGLFLREEAPLVWSYLTSQAYHEEHGDLVDSNRRFRAVLFDEGQPLQIEGAILVKNSSANSEVKDLAKKFLEYLISDEVQSLIPQKNWMFPVRSDVKLPLSFMHLPKPIRLIPISGNRDQTEELLSLWSQAIEK